MILVVLVTGSGDDGGDGVGGGGVVVSVMTGAQQMKVTLVVVMKLAYRCTVTPFPHYFASEEIDFYEYSESERTLYII